MANSFFHLFFPFFIIFSLRLFVSAYLKGILLRLPFLFNCTFLPKGKDVFKSDLKRFSFFN
ncbi:hypothetical protein CHCC5027_2793 [Bacillus paralicheniformis]|nr:hypothetical protein CHCC5027_2793 [Bacillus paralicheniformis]